MHAVEVEADTPSATTRPRVRSLRLDDVARWSAYVAHAPLATFFHRIEWRDVFAEVFRHRTHYLLAERGDVLVGVLPLVEVRSRLFDHALVSLPFCVYGGPLADDAAAMEALVDAAEALGRSLGVAHLELRNRGAAPAGWPTGDLYVTFRREILPDPEANMLAIPRKQRAMVRKGIKNGLVSEIDAHPDRFFALYADNQHRHGTPAHSRAYFECLVATFRGDCEFLTVLTPGGRPVSAVLSFRFRDEILPYYAGDLVEARELAANDFKYWEVMRRACERGLAVFDFGRSKRGTGSYDFKKNWGFDPTPLSYAYCLYHGGKVPQQNPLNSRYRAMIAVWRRLPRSVIDMLGPHIIRGLS